MGYRGMVQYIGACGHPWAIDDSVLSYGDAQERKAALQCPVCGKPAAHFATIDLTNGSGEQYGSNTVEAPTKEIGFTEEWKTDHHGNRYALKFVTVEPVGPRWEEI